MQFARRIANSRVRGHGRRWQQLPGHACASRWREPQRPAEAPWTRRSAWLLGPHGTKSPDSHGQVSAAEDTGARLSALQTTKRAAARFVTCSADVQRVESAHSAAARHERHCAKPSKQQGISFRLRDSCRVDISAVCCSAVCEGAIECQRKIGLRRDKSDEG